LGTTLVGTPIWRNPLRETHFGDAPYGPIWWTPLGDQPWVSTLGDTPWGTEIGGPHVEHPLCGPLWGTPIWRPLFRLLREHPLQNPIQGHPIVNPLRGTHLGDHPGEPHCWYPLEDIIWGPPWRIPLGVSIWGTPVAEPHLGVHQCVTPSRKQTLGTHSGNPLWETSLDPPYRGPHGGPTFGDHAWGTTLGGTTLGTPIYDSPLG
jgi:hypothetical protein